MVHYPGGQWSGQSEPAESISLFLFNLPKPEILLEKLALARAAVKDLPTLNGSNIFNISVGFFRETSIVRVSPNSESLTMHFPPRFRSQIAIISMLALFLHLLTYQRVSRLIPVIFTLQ